MGYHYVFANKGPRAGTRWIIVDDADLAAATGVDGWGVEMLPGVNMIADYSVPPEEWSEDWVIPGWNAPPAIVDPPWTPPSPPPSPPTPNPVSVLSLWNTNPAQVVVATANIGKFANGDLVTMAGVPTPYGFVNGAHTIANVGTPANHFELVGVDLSAAPANIGDAGMTATPPAPPAA